jgi:hypothetical protein
MTHIASGHQVRCSSPFHFFKAADQLSTIVTGTDRASSVALLTRKLCPLGAGA